MYGFFAILIVLAGILMVGVVLIQNSKGGGLAANFTSGNQILGARQTTDFIEKFTWYLVAIMFVLCFAASAAIPRSTVKAQRSVVQERVQGAIPGLQTPVGTAPVAEPEATQPATEQTAPESN
jgi:preprotein translocase subunit SecG